MTGERQGHRGDSLWPKEHNRQRQRSTFEVNVYLVPQDPSRAHVGAGARMLTHLERRQIVGAYYDLGLGWLAPGARSSEAFPHAPADRPAFEYAIVWEGREEFLPNAHTGPFGARCDCGLDLDDSLHAFLEQQATGASVRDARIRCECGRATPLGELVTDVATAITGLYVNFCHVDCTEIDPALLAELGELAGSPLRVLRERL